MINEERKIQDFGKNIMEKVHNYEKEIKAINTSEDMKILVRKMFCDTDISDIDFSDFIYQDIIPRLKELSIKIYDYDDETNESGFETILKENY